MQKQIDIKLLQSMFVIGAFVLIGKFAGAGKEIVIAYRYGTSVQVDAYVFAYALVSLIPMVWTVVLATAYPPLYARSRNSDVGTRFLAQLFLLTVALGFLISMLFYHFAPQVLSWMLSNRDQVFIEELKNTIQGLSLMIFPLFMVGFYGAYLLARERHINSISDGIPSLLIIFFLLLPWFHEDQNILVISTVLGMVCQLGFLMYLGGFSFLQPAKSKPSGINYWPMFRQAMGILILGQLIMSIAAPYDLYLANMDGDGAVATFGYAQRILMLGMSLGATAIARAMLPVISTIIHDGGSAKSRVVYWAFGMFLLGMILIVVGWYMVPSVVSLLFERGEFTADDSKSVSHVIRFGLMQLPFYFGGMVLLQLYAADHRFVEIVWSSVLALSVKLVIGWPLAMKFGLPGIMISSAVMYSLTFVYFLVRISKSTQKADTGR